MNLNQYEGPPTLMQKRILRAILRSPYGAYRDQIIEAMYYDREEPDTSHKTMSVHLHRLRYKLRTAGVNIKKGGWIRAGARYLIPEDQLDAAYRFLEREAARPVNPNMRHCDLGHAQPMEFHYERV